MKEHPILFSGEMVRAILEGRKTQTRRILKPQPANGYEHFECHRDGTCEVGVSINCCNIYQIHCPFGGVGDRLWVKETFQKLYDPDGKCANRFEATTPPTGHHVIYRATDKRPEGGNWSWRPSIFMPRWASRITLEIVDIGVERLQRISEADAEAEGMEHWDGTPGKGSAVTRYAVLWEKINGRGAWGKNPFVWKIVFKKLQ